MSLPLTAKPYRDTLQTGHGPAQVSQSRGGCILQGGEASLPDNKLWDFGPLAMLLSEDPGPAAQEPENKYTVTSEVAWGHSSADSMHEALCSIPAPHKSCMVLHTWNL